MWRKTSKFQCFWVSSEGRPIHYYTVFSRRKHLRRKRLLTWRECLEVAFWAPAVSYCWTFSLLLTKPGSCWITFGLCGRVTMIVRDIQIWRFSQQHSSGSICLWPLKWKYTATIAVRIEIAVHQSLGNCARYGESWLKYEVLERDGSPYCTEVGHKLSAEKSVLPQWSQKPWTERLSFPRRRVP